MNSLVLGTPVGGRANRVMGHVVEEPEEDVVIGNPVAAGNGDVVIGNPVAGNGEVVIGNGGVVIENSVENGGEVVGDVMNGGVGDYVNETEL